MTRFMLDVDEAVDVIEKSFRHSGYNIIPNIRSFKVKDLFEIFSKEFGMKYKIGKPRISEKLHEIMIANEEVPRTSFNSNDNIYLMHYKNIVLDNKIEFNEFSSRDYVVSKSKLYEILKKNNFFRI